MESLPSEMHSFIVHQCNKEDTMNLRLVSKAFYNDVTRRLFSTLYVKNTDIGIQSYQNILSSSHLAKSVCQINFITMEDPEEYEDRYPGGAELSLEFSEALESICKFPNLTGVGIHFSKECSVYDPSRWYVGRANESPEYRSDVIKALFRGLNNLDYPTPNVRSLSINNLQNVNDSEIVSSDNFRSVLSRLTTLRLKVVSEWETVIPGSTWRLPAMYQFFTELPQVWLAPCAANLTSLKPHVDCRWGYLPKADFRGLHLPKLRKLDLGNYTFRHDWQLEWILSHGATLEELTLDDCPIVHCIQSFGQLDSEGYVVNHANREISPESAWTHERRWSHYFSEMEKRLPKLKNSRYGIGPWGVKGPNHFEDDVLDESVGEKGYIGFDMGLHPTPWVENERGYITDGELAKFGFPTAEFENDKAAYDRLVDIVVARGT